VHFHPLGPLDWHRGDEPLDRQAAKSRVVKPRQLGEPFQPPVPRRNSCLIDVNCDPQVAVPVCLRQRADVVVMGQVYDLRCAVVPRGVRGVKSAGFKDLAPQRGTGEVVEAHGPSLADPALAWIPWPARATLASVSVASRPHVTGGPPPQPG
jgi:hypothetical protein